MRAHNLICVLIMTVPFWGEKVAAEVVNIRYQTYIPPLVGQYPDGTLIGIATVDYSGVANGFDVWLENRQEGSLPQLFTLEGSENKKHVISVRLEGDGWQDNNERGKGVSIKTSDSQVMVKVLLDGTQFIWPDSYNLTFSGVAITP